MITDTRFEMSDFPPVENPCVTVDSVTVMLHAIQQSKIYFHSKMVTSVRMRCECCKLKKIHMKEFTFISAKC